MIEGIKNNLPVILIVALALILRFYRLDVYPALNADEAAIGYNAYSLIQTGEDEHGHPWPIHFQSFNDFKPGLYFYLVLPFVKVLGLNEWAVRIPGAMIGALTVLVIYFLTKELFKNENLSRLSALFLAISPWHIHFSRGGWEVNVAGFFVVSGLLFLLQGFRKPKALLLSALLFVLSLYTYHAARIVVPLLLLGILFIYRDNFRKNLKTFIPSLIFGALLLMPLVFDFTRGGAVSRAAGVGLFADPGPLNRINEQRGEHTDFTGLFPRLLHNKGVNYGLAFLKNWADHFHGEFLFLSGDAIQRNKVPETGQMYMFDILLLAIGIIFLVKNLSRESKLIFWWLGVSPVAAALTFQSPHALRSGGMAVPLVIISAYGAISLLELVKTNRKRLLSIVSWGLVLVVGLSFARYVHMYWAHMSKEYSFSSQYGVKELAAFIEENQGNYQKIIVTDRYDQPYILFLFYLKYPPDVFQKEHALSARDSFGFSTVRDFGKYHFESIDFDKIRPENPNSLIVGTPEEIPAEANIIKEIYGTNGQMYFKVVAN